MADATQQEIFITKDIPNSDPIPTGNWRIPARPGPARRPIHAPPAPGQPVFRPDANWGWGRIIHMKR